MKKALRFVAVAVLGLTMTTGVASATTGSIDTTGPNSYNEVRSDYRKNVDVRNRNNVRLENSNDQFAQSGDATVSYNTTGGDAWTGDAANDNWTEASVSIDNSASSEAALGYGGGGGGWGGGSIDFTGPGSDNVIDSRYRVDVNVENTNNVDVSNESVQTAVSGDAKVYGNTRGGDARTGDATNVNTTELMVEITN